MAPVVPLVGLIVSAVSTASSFVGAAKGKKATAAASQWKPWEKGQDVNAMRAASFQSRFIQQRKGFASTMLTGPQGVQDKAISSTLG